MTEKHHTASTNLPSSHSASSCFVFLPWTTFDKYWLSQTRNSPLKSLPVPPPPPLKTTAGIQNGHKDMCKLIPHLDLKIKNSQGDGVSTTHSQKTSFPIVVGVFLYASPSWGCQHAHLPLLTKDVPGVQEAQTAMKQWLMRPVKRNSGIIICRIGWGAWELVAKTCLMGKEWI